MAALASRGRHEVDHVATSNGVGPLWTSNLQGSDKICGMIAPREQGVFDGIYSSTAVEIEFQVACWPP